MKQEQPTRKCTNCVNLRELMCHPCNKKIAVGSISERFAYVCIAIIPDGTNSLKSYCFENPLLGSCEMHIFADECICGGKMIEVYKDKEGKTYDCDPEEDLYDWMEETNIIEVVKECTKCGRSHSKN